MVGAAVAGEEGDPPPGDLAQEKGVARRPMGRGHAYLGHVVEDGVEARAANDADLDVLRVRHDRTLPGPENAVDPAVVRRQGLVRKPYAAELLLEEVPVPDDDE